jgi:cytochrome c-type biogenesis protein CcmH/NrfF
MRRISRAGRVLVICLVAAVAMGASYDTGRYNDLGHKMMCACGCGQVLIECNHVGCPDSDQMLAELRADLAQGQGDNAILEAFQEKYGPTILAAPMFSRFNVIAWIVPPALLLLGIAGIVLLVRRWRLRAAAEPAVEQGPVFQAMREKIRRETQL